MISNYNDNKRDRDKHSLELLAKMTEETNPLMSLCCNILELKMVNNKVELLTKIEEIYNKMNKR